MSLHINRTPGKDKDDSKLSAGEIEESMVHPEKFDEQWALDSTSRPLAIAVDVSCQLCFDVACLGVMAVEYAIFFPQPVSCMYAACTHACAHLFI